MTVREFYTRHRRDPGFTQWFETAKLLTGVLALSPLLRFDLLTRAAPKLVHVAPPENAAEPTFDFQVNSIRRRLCR